MTIERRNTWFLIGIAVQSLMVALATSILIYLILYFGVANSPVRLYFDYIINNPYESAAKSITAYNLYQKVQPIDQAVTLFTMLAGGFYAGIRLSDRFGRKTIYSISGGVALFIILLVSIFLMGGKMIYGKPHDFSQFTLSSIIMQLLYIVISPVSACIGSELGRQFAPLIKRIAESESESETV